MSNDTLSSLLPALGIDHGDARIGLSVTDLLGILCFPVETISVAKVDPITRIADICKQRGIKTLVLGLPLRIDGSMGSAAEKVKLFGDKLQEACPQTPLHYVDERLTTVLAHEKMQEAGRKAKHRKDVIDQAAAVEILQSWLDEKLISFPHDGCDPFEF